MKIIVGRSLGIEKTALFQEISRSLGFARNGEKITTALNAAFKQLQMSGTIEIKGDIVSIK